ncbi:hypothetical protein, partial [Methylosinus sp. R-45379]|uniref:hypothetical protein n=1 Tax=Methylosinus sp. R-45379 TaxID=980563 RepID=UPI001AEC88FA
MKDASQNQDGGFIVPLDYARDVMSKTHASFRKKKELKPGPKWAKARVKRYAPFEDIDVIVTRIRQTDLYLAIDGQPSRSSGV